MASKNRKELYDLFRTGNKPTQDDFADLIDSMVNINDDGIGVSEKGRPIEIVQQGTKERFLDLSSAKEQPVWRVSGQSNAGIKGLNVATADDKSRLFIKREDGCTGINNDNPKAKLHITPDTGRAFQVDNNAKEVSFVIDANGNIGIGTTIQDNYKVAIDGRVNLKGETVVNSPILAEKGITVKGARFAAEEGVTVKNGVTVETGLIEARDGLNVDGKPLVANTGVTVNGLPLHAQKGLVVEEGAVIQNGNLRAEEGLTVNGGAIIDSGKLEAKAGLDVEKGAVIASGRLEAREGLYVQGPAIFNNELSSEGRLTAKGDVIVTDGAALTADGQVSLGNPAGGEVAVNGVLRAKQGIIVEDSKLEVQEEAVINELRVENGLSVYNGAAFEEGLVTVKEGLTLPPNSALHADGPVSLGNDESGGVTINGVLQVNNETAINGGATITGDLVVSNHTILEEATIDRLHVKDFNYEGTLGLESVEIHSLTADNGEFATLSLTGGLDVDGPCLMMDNVIFNSGLLYATYEGPGSKMPRIKIVRGVTGKKGHFGITVSADKLVTIVYDDETEIDNFLEDWAEYKTAHPVETEGINFHRLGRSSWQVQEMEMGFASTGEPFKEYIIEDQGLRLIYAGPAEKAQFEIIANEDPESIFFGFLMEEGKLTIIYPADPAGRQVDNLIEEWGNWVLHHQGDTYGFEIVKTDGATGEEMVTDVALTDLRENTAGDVFAKAIIKTNIVTVCGCLKFADSGVFIDSLSDDEDLRENSNNVLPTQKAVRTYVDKGFSELRTDLEDVTTNLGEIGTNLKDVENSLDDINKDLGDVKGDLSEVKENLDLVGERLGEAERKLDEKADQGVVEEALANKANLEKTEDFSVDAGAIVSLDGLALTGGSSGFLLVMVTAAGYSGAGLFAVNGTGNLFKIAGDRLSEWPDNPDTCNLYFQEGDLMLQNATEEEVGVKAIYFGT